MNILDHLTQSVLERDKPGWRRVEVTPKDIERYTQEDVYNYPRCFVGTHHVTNPSLKRRFISFTEYPVTYGEMAREYLRQCYEQSEWHGPPPRGPSPAHPWWAKRAPIFTQHTTHVAMAYVDIDHAYWSLLQPYCADHLITEGDKHVAGCVQFLWPDAVDVERRLRHAVVGCLFSHRIGWMSFGEWKEAPQCAPWSNPSLARLCYDTLHAIAVDVRKRFECFAWLTDAGIVRNGGGMVQLLQERWGLTSKIEAEGMGAVWSPSTYQVGTKRTENIRSKRADFTVTNFDNIPKRHAVEKYRRWRMKAIGA